MHYIPPNPHPSQSTLISGSASEEIKGTDFLSQLPKEILLTIFSFLSAKELAKCDPVCKTWKRLASDKTLLKAFDPKNLSPLIKVFDESDWSKHVDMSAYGLTTGDLPSLDKRKEITLLERVLSSPLMTEIEGNAGVTLLTIPNGLTFNKFVKLARSPKVGNITKFQYIEAGISSKIGDMPVKKTYRIAITNNVFKDSRNLSVSDQKALVEKIGCKMPRVLEAAMLLGVTFMSSEERLYNDNPITFTCCSEQVADEQLYVGCFDSNGICVDASNVCSQANGAGGVLPF